MLKRLAIVFLALMAISQLAAAPKTDAERESAMQSITWLNGPSFVMPVSGATVTLQPGLQAVAGRDAATIWGVVNGVDGPTGLEGMIYDDHRKEVVYFQKVAEGFVKMDDWNDVDADEMIRQVREATEADNVKRRAAGLTGLDVLGWLEKPHLDRQSATIRWAIEAKDEDRIIVNRIALVLNRDGYEKLTWIGPKSDIASDLLTVAQAALVFPDGKRYADFRDGDAVAAYGAAGLLASVLGVKTAAKLGLLALLAAFAKKAGVLLILPFVALFGFIRNKLKGGKNSDPS
jgi:uncharacterized membrane-anchored protein